MSSAKKIWKDIRRSIGIMLALIMVASVVISIPIEAAETLEIVDTGKMIGMGFADYNSSNGDENFVFQTYKKVIIMSEDEGLLNKNPVLTANVYVTIDGKKYEVIKLSSKPAYDSKFDTIGITYYEDGAYQASMSPVYYRNVDDGTGSYHLEEITEQGSVCWNY